MTIYKLIAGYIIKQMQEKLLSDVSFFLSLEFISNIFYLLSVRDL